MTPWPSCRPIPTWTTCRTSWCSVRDRSQFASEALAAGVSIFELARLMRTSVAMIDRTYGHLARDSEDTIRARLDARARRLGVDQASTADGDRDDWPKSARLAGSSAMERTGIEPVTSGLQSRAARRRPCPQTAANGAAMRVPAGTG
jgi:hypothetical protein